MIYENYLEASNGDNYYIYKKNVAPLREPILVEKRMNINFLCFSPYIVREGRVAALKE